MTPADQSLLREAAALVAAGLPEERLPRHARDLLLAHRSRAADMERRYRAGETLQQIGDRYGISRERVRQVIAKRGVMAADGGARLKAARSRAQRAALLDAKYLRKYGCTHAQYWSVNKRGYSISSDYYRTPMGAFLNQRRNAKERGIPWEFTFWSWWQVWDKSGHWHERGRGRGYVMARHGDEGPYSPTNVKIVPATENIAEYFDRERATHGRVRPGHLRKAA